VKVRRWIGKAAAVGVGHGEGGCFVQVSRQMAEGMTRAAVMMVRVFVAVMATRFVVLVVGVATSVRRHDFMLVRGLARSRLPGEGGRQYGRQKNGD